MSDHEPKRRKKRKSQNKNDAMRTDSESDKGLKNVKEGKKSKRHAKHHQSSEDAPVNSGNSCIIKSLFFILIIALAVGVGIVMMALQGTDSSSFGGEVVEKIQTLINDIKPEAVPAHVEYDPIITESETWHDGSKIELSENLAENVLNEAELQDTYGIHLGMPHSSGKINFEEFSGSSQASPQGDESNKPPYSSDKETFSGVESDPRIEEKIQDNTMSTKNEHITTEESGGGGESNADKSTNTVQYGELKDPPKADQSSRVFPNDEMNVPSRDEMQSSDKLEMPLNTHQPPASTESAVNEKGDLSHSSPEIEVQSHAQTQTEPSSVSSQNDQIRQQYEKGDITNDYDSTIRQQLNRADENLEHSPDQALNLFKHILRHHTQSARAKYGLAQAYDKLSGIHRSNTFLDLAISNYMEVLDVQDVPPLLFLLSAERAANRSMFRGLYGKAVKIQKKIIENFPQNTTVKNQLAVSYLMMGKNRMAEQLFREVLKLDPSNGFAKVHLGFILKTDYSDYEKSADLISEGIATRAPGTIDGRFFYHLGDAYFRLGSPEKAHQVYVDGAELGVFLSANQRSLYNVNGLTSKPWWNFLNTKYGDSIKMLEKNWLAIRDEGVALLRIDKNGFSPESEGLQDKGDWQQLELFARGKKNEKNCQRAPKTCSLMMGIPDAIRCNRCQTKFSVMHPGTHVWPHTGPTNCRLRAHLGLVVPSGPLIRVSNETKSWQEGKVMVFDDSFEHEVWHSGDKPRLILIVDFWHPDLTAEQKATMVPI